MQREQRVTQARLVQLETLALPAQRATPVLLVQLVTLVLLVRLELPETRV